MPNFPFFFVNQKWASSCIQCIVSIAFYFYIDIIWLTVFISRLKTCEPSLLCNLIFALCYSLHFFDCSWEWMFFICAGAVQKFLSCELILQRLLFHSRIFLQICCNFYAFGLQTFAIHASGPSPGLANFLILFMMLVDLEFDIFM